MESESTINDSGNWSAQMEKMIIVRDRDYSTGKDFFREKLEEVISATWIHALNNLSVFWKRLKNSIPSQENK